MIFILLDYFEIKSSTFTVLTLKNTNK